MSFTIWPPYAAAPTSTTAIAVTSTSVPHTPDNQWVSTPMDAVPFILIGILIGAVVGKALGRREAIKRITSVVKGGGKHQ